MKVTVANTIDDWRAVARIAPRVTPLRYELVAQIKAQFEEQAGPECDGSSMLTMTLDAPDEYWRTLKANPPWGAMGYSQEGAEASRAGRGLARLMEQVQASTE